MMSMPSLAWQLHSREPNGPHCLPPQHAPLINTSGISLAQSLSHRQSSAVCLYCYASLTSDYIDMTAWLSYRHRPDDYGRLWLARLRHHWCHWSTWPSRSSIHVWATRCNPSAKRAEPLRIDGQFLLPRGHELWRVSALGAVSQSARHLTGLPKPGKTWQSDPKHMGRSARLEIFLSRCPSDTMELSFASPFFSPPFGMTANEEGWLDHFHSHRTW